VAIKLGARSAPMGLDRIRTLAEDDVPALRLDWQDQIQEDDVRRTLFTYPGRSVWLPETLEFAIVAPWRHRQEIANLRHLVAVRHPSLLAQAAVDRAQQAGAVMIVSVDVEQVRQPQFYRDLGFSLIEEVVTYELDRLPPPRGDRGRLRFEAVDPADDGARAQLLAIDRAAFPWLWRNSDLEFRAYGLVPGVELFLGSIGDEALAYVGITTYLGWGHLDRIAVVPQMQGAGLGREALGFAVDRLSRRGARRIGLSTQRRNVHSQRLYERFGFRRSYGTDYRLYGRFLVELPSAIIDDSGTSSR
jgi:ribosomal protein S18 acetylase RimI-like enzyme